MKGEMEKDKREGYFICDKYMIPEMPAIEILGRLNFTTTPSRIRSIQIIMGNLIRLRLYPGRPWLAINYNNAKTLSRTCPIKAKVYGGMLREMEKRKWIDRKNWLFKPEDPKQSKLSRIKLSDYVPMDEVLELWDMMPDSDDDRELLQIKARKTGDMIPVPHTNLARHLEDQMDRINANLICHQISYDNEPIKIFPTLYRTFTNDLYHNGRIYGHYITNMSKKDRKHIKIDGEQTVILDYKAIHPSIIYAIKGLAIPADMYGGDLPFEYPEKRKLLKKALLISLNSNSIVQANIALRNIIHEDESMPHIDSLMADQALVTVRDHNKEISDCFDCDLSLTLMAIESHIAVSILLWMAKINKPCIPIHDGFMCKESDSEALEIAMEHICWDILGDIIPADIE